jgi:hypothetical protein
MGELLSVDEELAELALQLAEDRFEEEVAALIVRAKGDRSELAMAAARLSAEGPTRGDSKEQIAFALLLEAAHRATADRPDLQVVR